MKIPVSYIIRNLWTRRLTTVLTAGGLALVVFVFATVLMLDEGLKTTLVTTGEYDNAVLIRRSAETEVQSSVDRTQAATIIANPAIALGLEGQPMVSMETVVLISLNKRGTEKPSNVIIRGVSPLGFPLRPQVKLSAGRMFRPGTAEIVAGTSIAKRFVGAGIGETLRFGQREWAVVGVFDAGNSGFDSEIWGDADQLMQAFRRYSYSSVIVRLNDTDRFAAFKQDIEGDPRLTLEAKREQTFYSDQSKALSTFISILGMTLSVIFSLGAMIGAMITMYASVANRVSEIGTLRAIGFRRQSIMVAFLAESLLLSLIGGAVGLLLASLMQIVSFSTTNFQSFSELAFGFHLTLQIAIKSLAFAFCMGLLGGFLPSLRAASMKIVDSLRAA